MNDSHIKHAPPDQPIHGLFEFYTGGKKWGCITAICSVFPFIFLYNHHSNDSQIGIIILCVAIFLTGLYFVIFGKSLIPVYGILSTGILKRKGTFRLDLTKVNIAAWIETTAEDIVIPGKELNLIVTIKRTLRGYDFCSISLNPRDGGGTPLLCLSHAYTGSNLGDKEGVVAVLEGKQYLISGPFPFITD